MKTENKIAKVLEQILAVVVIIGIVAAFAGEMKVVEVAFAIIMILIIIPVFMVWFKL
jgi:hypothetical protein